jgi:Na+:H+ antiporter, NhaA family
MPLLQLTQTFKEFFESEKSGGIVLALCTVVALIIANSSMGAAYQHVLHANLFGLSVSHWVNDGLMAIFFLLIGLELERELYNGELSDIKKASLPIFAAIGGVAVPALIHFGFNQGLPTQSGVAIPMATDIAFVIGALAILGSRAPDSLKIFVVAFAIADDLIAILVIALFYTSMLQPAWLLASGGIFAALVVLNKLRVMLLLPYLIGGILLWVAMLKSGVHATLAGILLAFAVPFSGKENHASPSHKLEHFLHTPVTWLILPIFALANTGIAISSGAIGELLSANALGIMCGLVLGKPIGVMLGYWFATKTGIASTPEGLNWQHILGAGILGGIAFTMSIFITNLAFENQDALINSSKLAILCASVIAGVVGYWWLSRIKN